MGKKMRKGKQIFIYIRPSKNLDRLMKKITLQAKLHSEQLQRNCLKMFGTIP